ncbi:hypothetical protein D3C74_425470 [compost metagenome]
MTARLRRNDIIESGELLGNAACQIIGNFTNQLGIDISAAFAKRIQLEIIGGVFIFINPHVFGLADGFAESCIGCAHRLHSFCLDIQNPRIQETPAEQKLPEESGHIKVCGCPAWDSSVLRCLL